MRWRAVLERVPDAVPVLALLAAGLARTVPSNTVAAHIDLLLAALVLVSALDIDPRALAPVLTRWRTVLLLSLVPLCALAGGAWLLGQLFSGSTREGLLALGVSPSEVASVGLVGLIGGSTELAVAVLTLSLIVSVTAGPPLLTAISGASRHANAPALLGRFALVVLVPLLLGLCARWAAPRLARRRSELAATSSLLVALLVYAALCGARQGAVGAPLAASGAFLGLSALLALVIARRSSLTLVIAMRDFAVAAALAAGAFGAGAARVAGVYGVLMLFCGASVAGVARSRNASQR